MPGSGDGRLAAGAMAGENEAGGVNAIRHTGGCYVRFTGSSVSGPFIPRPPKTRGGRKKNNKKQRTTLISFSFFSNNGTVTRQSTKAALLGRVFWGGGVFLGWGACG